MHHERDFEVLSPKSPLEPSAQGSGVCVEKETERLEEPEAMKAFKETVSSGHNWADAHMNLQRPTKAAHTNPSQTKFQ